jgi:hypothetical protein
MNLRGLKNIMKEVNEPNGFILEPFDLQHPFYWIFRVKNVRIKHIFSDISHLRSNAARFDTFINGLFIRSEDYKYEHRDGYFYIKFIRSKFPELDRFENPYEIEETDEIKIEGDLENIN